MSEPELPSTAAAERELTRGHRAARLALLAVAGLAVALAAGFGWAASAWRAESLRVAEAARMGSLERARALVAAGGADAREDALAALESARPIEPADVGLARSASALLSVRERDFWPVAEERRFGAVAASADASAVLFSPEPGTIEVWNVRARKRLARVTSGRDEFHYPVLSPDGSHLAARRDGGDLVVWSLADGKEVISRRARRTASSRQTVAFAPEGDALFFADQESRSVHGLPLSGGRDFASWDIGRDLGPLAVLSCEMVAAGCSDGVRILLENGVSQLVLPTPVAVTSLAWRPDGKLLVAGLSDGRVAFHHRPTARNWMPRIHDSLVSGVHFSPDGKLLATAGWDGRTVWHDGAGHARLLTQRRGVMMALGDGRALFYRGELGVGEWAVTAPSGYRRFHLPGEIPGEISGLAIDSGAGLLAASNRESVRFFEIETGDLVAEKDWPVARGLALSGSDFLVAGSRGVAVLRPKTNGDGSWSVERVRIVEGTKDRSLSDVAVSGDAVATTGNFGFILTGKRESETLPGLPSGEEARVALADNGRIVAGSCWKGMGTAVQGKDGMTRLAHPGGSVALSPAGDRAILGSNGGYSIWKRESAADWQSEATFSDDQGGDFPGKAVFSNEGSHAAWLWRQSGIALVDLTGARPHVSERFHPAGDSSLFALTLSEDDRWLAAGSGNGAVHLWDLAWPSPLPNRTDPLAAPAPRRVTMALVAALTALLIAGTAAGWLVRRERRLLQGFIDSQNELHAQRERLRLSERMETLGRLSAGVAHDFRNILSIIRVRSGLLRRAVADDAVLAGDADAIEGAVCKAEGVVRSLLQIGRSGSGIEDSFDAAAELLGLEGLFAAKSKGVEGFEIHAEEELPPAAGRGVEFQQIALNLGWNAIDAVSADGGRVGLSLSASLPPEPERVVLTAAGEPAMWLVAEDSGPGLGEGESDRLFDPFYSTKGLGPERGTGLGLSIVHGICRTRGYALAIGRSPRLGGAFFAVGLPPYSPPE